MDPRLPPTPPPSTPHHTTPPYTTHPTPPHTTPHARTYTHICTTQPNTTLQDCTSLASLTTLAPLLPRPIPPSPQLSLAPTSPCSHTDHTPLTRPNTTRAFTPQSATGVDEGCSEESSEETVSSEELDSDALKLVNRFSIVHERCGYKLCYHGRAKPLLDAKGAREAAKRWVILARKQEGTTSVKSFENAIAMYYLADFVCNDEPKVPPVKYNAR